MFQEKKYVELIDRIALLEGSQLSAELFEQAKDYDTEAIAVIADALLDGCKTERQPALALELYEVLAEGGNSPVKDAEAQVIRVRHLCESLPYTESEVLTMCRGFDTWGDELIFAVFKAFFADPMLCKRFLRKFEQLANRYGREWVDEKDYARRFLLYLEFERGTI